MNRFTPTLVIGFTVILTACGGGGGGGGAGSASTAALTCTASKVANGMTLCLNEVKVDGASWSAGDMYVAGASDLTGDGIQDIAYSLNSASALDNTVAGNRKPVYFLKGTSNPYAFTSWNPTINGVTGGAGGFYTRDIVFGNFDGSGHTSLYIADESEFVVGAGFNGVTQYTYINDGAGNFTKVDTGIGVGSIHGSSIGNLTNDGFSVIFNNPWTPNPNVIAQGYNLATPTTVGVVKTAPMFNGAGKCFYTAAVMLKNAKSAGGVNSSKRDVVCFSPGDTTALVNNHTIMYNDGSGNFNVTAPDTLVNSGSVGWTVEDVAVGNFSGHTDDREDFVVIQVDRSAANTQNTSLHIYITDTNGIPHDRTSSYFGAGCTSCTDFASDAGGFHRIHASDLNKDGKSDLVFMRDPLKNGTRQIEVLLNQGANTAFKRATFTQAAGEWMGPSVHLITSSTGTAEIMFNFMSKLYIGVIQ